MQRSLLATAYWKISSLLAVVLLVALAALVPITHAAPNLEINYQGKLTDNTGATVSNGDYAITFNLYTQDTGGVSIWTEEATTTVTNGLFSYMMGSTSDLSGVNFNQTLYLGVEIDSDGEMSPRKVLGTVPAAFEAQQFGGLATTSFLRSDQADTAASLLTFTNGLISQSSSTITNLTSLYSTTTNFTIGGSLYDNDVSSGQLGYVLQSTGSGLTWVATSTLGFAAASTTHDAITLAGSYDYLTLSGQEITLDQLDLTTDVTGALSVSNGGTGATALTGLLLGNGTSAFTATTSLASSYIEDVYLRNDGDIATGDYTFDTDTLFVDSANNRVGIGTTSPGTLLDVYGSGTSDLFRVSRDTNASLGLSFPSNQPTFTGTGDIVFKDTGAEIFRADASTNGLAVGGYTVAPTSGLSVNGDVGIGTTTPDYTLHVAGSSHTYGKISASNADTVTGLFFENDAVSWLLRNNGAANSDAFEIKSSNNADPSLVIDTDGNVGIGTTSPNSILDIQGGAATALNVTGTVNNAGINVSSVSNSYLTFTDGSSPWKIQNDISGGGDLKFSTNEGLGGTTVTFDRSGNVGIGTTSPGASLQVDDVIRVANHGTNVGQGDSGGALEFFNLDSTVGGGVAARINARAEDSGRDYALDFETGRAGDSNVALTILANDSAGSGNVGIGTSTPTRTLSVAGDMVLDGAFYDNAGDSGSAGEVLWSTGSGLRWVSTSSLNIAGSQLTENEVEAFIFDADAETITGNWEVQDDVNFTFGNNADWNIQYDEGVDDQLLFVTTNTAATATTDPLVEFLVGTTPTADQQVFGVAKGSQSSNTALLTLDEDGDFVVAGTLDATGGITINATTETNIETAIDTLANLNSVQGRTVTLADAGADAFFGWDDTASAYENLTANEALTIIGGVANDFDANGDVTITEADISDFAISTGDITDGTILEGDLNTDNAAANGDFLQYDSTGTNFVWRDATETKTDLSLENVENTALSTWAGTGNITTVGTLSSGTLALDSLSFSGTLDDTYINDTLTIGSGSTITDGLIVEADLDLNTATAGYVLQASSTASGGFAWTATSSLGISGSSLTFGSDNQIGYTNAGGDDFEYSSNFTFDGSLLTVAGTGVTLSGSTANVTLGSNYLSGDGDDEGVYVDSSGNVAIGHASPSTALDVQKSLSSQYVAEFINGHADGYGVYVYVGNTDVGKYALDVNNSAGTILRAENDGDVGVGVTDPDKRLEVFETVADAQFKISYDATRYANFQVDSTGGLHIDSFGDDVTLDSDNFWVCESGSCPSITASSTEGYAVIENGIYFGNGFKIDQITGTTTQLGVYNASGTPIVIFD